MVAYPDRGAGNDPTLFFFFFFLGGGGLGGGDSLSPPMLNIFTVGNMGVMMCLSQGGLRSLSAFSFVDVLGVFFLAFWGCLLRVLTSLVLVLVSSPMASFSGMSVKIAVVPLGCTTVTTCPCKIGTTNPRPPLPDKTCLF